MTHPFTRTLQWHLTTLFLSHTISLCSPYEGFKCPPHLSSQSLILIPSRFGLISSRKPEPQGSSCTHWVPLASSLTPLDYEFNNYILVMVVSLAPTTQKARPEKHLLHAHWPKKKKRQDRGISTQKKKPKKSLFLLNTHLEWTTLKVFTS